MSWLIFIAIYTIFFSVAALVQKTLMTHEEADPRAQTVADGVIRGAVALGIALAVGSFRPLPHEVLGYFLVAVLIDVAATVSYYRAMMTVQASTVGIAFSTMFMWVTLMSALFLHEQVSWLKGLGILTIFTGVMVSLWRQHKLRTTSGLFYAFLAPFLWGSVVTLSYFILRTYNAPSLETYENLAIVAVLLVLQPRVFKKMRFFLNRRHAALQALNGALASIASIANFYAYQFGRDATLLAPLSSTRIIFILILSALFLKERDYLPRKIIGALLACIGAILLLLP